jgi:hypothetical protein
MADSPQKGSEELENQTGTQSEQRRAEAAEKSFRVPEVKTKTMSLKDFDFFTLRHRDFALNLDFLLRALCSPPLALRSSLSSLLSTTPSRSGDDEAEGCQG